MALDNGRGRVSKEQIISRTDVLSEGPIYGLVNGASSIYFDDDNAVEKAVAGTSVSRTAANFTFTTGSQSVAISANGQDLSQYASSTGVRYLFIREYASATNSTAARVDATRLTITASSAIFAAIMERDDTEPTQAVLIRLVKNGVEYFKGYIETYTSTTVVTCVTMAGSSLNANYADASDYDVIVDGRLLISSFNSGVTSLTLAANSPITGTFQCDIGQSNFVADLSAGSTLNSDSKYEQFKFEMRNGYLQQTPISDVYGGTGATSVTSSISHSFNVSDTGTTWPDLTLGGAAILTSTELGLSAGILPQVDEVRITFAYPALQSTSASSGTSYVGICAYKIELDFDRGAGFSGSWANYSLGGDSHFIHATKQASSFSIEEIIDLEKYKPFNNFKLRVSKLTRDDIGVNYEGTYAGAGDYNVSLESSLSTAVSIVRERLTHPYTAYINTRVSTRNFTSPPNTSYQCKGLLVQVPSNYITRDESATGVANYERNVSTGAIETSYQNWDGALRTTPVYTNNPAWVFYDVIVNDRYGLGDWLSASDIDKYALYRIARYCDELVPDGKGGLEPRFVANLYLAKATQAYKVLKDIATIFRGMLYWNEGSIFPAIDQAEDPIYNFSKGNVIGGSFNYEGTSNKVRPNQFVVGWNNPDNNYAAEALIIEDRQNIIKTGKLIKEKATAFGTTSLGQATRYGRWKLWTAINQKELVSFSTSINAAFIQPGNIINVQDSDKHAVSYSGRISKTGTLSTTAIPLDRSITLSSNTYQLSILVEESGVFLTQETATIASVTYFEGDLIAGNFTEAQGANLLDDSGDPVTTTWAPHMRVEERTVSTGAGATSSLTVSTAFSVAPGAETIWALKELDTNGSTVQGSGKAYKVLSISEATKSTYDVVAVEHYNEKFFDIDQDFSSPYVDPLSVQTIQNDLIPTVNNVYVTKSGQDRNIVDIGWDEPVNEDGSIYEYVDKYEFIHNIPGFDSPAYSTAGSTSTGSVLLPPGDYQVAIRTISTYGKKSAATTINFSVVNASEFQPTKNKGLILGATITSPIYITDTGVIKVENPSFKIATAGAPQTIYSYSTELADTYIQDASGIASQNFSAMSDVEATYKSNYLYFDASDTSDPWKLVRYQDVAVNQEPLNVEYLYDTGDGSLAKSTAFSNQTGTVSVPSNSTVVTGTGTAFTTEFTKGKIIKFNATDAAEIIYIESDTVLKIDRKFSSAITGVTPAVSVFTHDSILDTAIAQVRNNSGTFELLPIELIVSPDLETRGRVVTLFCDPNLLNFDGSSTLTTSYTNLVLTSTATGFISPEFKVTGAGFANAEISQTAETVYSAANVGVNGYSLTLDKVSTFNTTDLEFTVEVRETEDPTSTSKVASSNITVPFLKDGTLGTSGSDGDNVDIIFKRSATQPATPSASAGTPATWYSDVSSVPAGTDTMWSCVGAQVAGVGNYTWNVPVAIEGTAIAELSIYLRASSAPSTPTGGSYDFSTKVLTVPSGGWSVGVPTGTDPVYISRTVAAAAGVDKTDTSLTWSSPVISFRDGTDGAAGSDGDSVDIVFKRSASQPTTPSASAGTPATWYSDISSVPVTTDPLWSSTGLLLGGGTNYTWDTPVSQEGTAVAELSTFIRSASAPSTPTGGSYNFSTNVLTAPTSWSAGVPIGTDPVYISRAVATVSGVSGTDSSLTWSTPVISFQNGADGSNGSNGSNGSTGLRRSQGYVYYSTAQAGNPGKPDVSVTPIYTWATGAITNMVAGWSLTPPEMSAGTSAIYWVSRYDVAQTSSANTTNTPTFTVASKGHNFSGVVTFSGGTFSDSGVAITTIDGGNISTGSITANKIGGSKSGGTHDFGFATGGIDINGTTYDCSVYGSSTDTTDCVTGYFENYATSGADTFALAGVTRYGIAAAFARDINGDFRTATPIDQYIQVCDGTYYLNATASGVAKFSVATSGNIVTAGSITADGDITAFSSSDKALKDNIVAISNPLDKVMQIGGYEFDWNSTSDYSGNHDVGVIAQEIKEVMPEIVVERDNGMLAVRYEKLVPLLIEAIKELKEEVEELKNGSSIH